MPATDQLLQNDSILAITAPHVRDHFGVWGIQPEYLQETVDRLQGANFADHLKIQGTAPGRSRFGQPYSTQDDGTAVIELRGALTKAPTSFSSGTSTIEARRQIRHAAANESIQRILLVIESPGGTMAGTFDLAHEVALANKRKPVVVYIEDLCASAAYWVASQAGKVYCGPTALVGCIGTYQVLRDFSQAASQIGLKVHVVKAGKHKGAGVPGTEITPEQLAHFQQVIDSANELFLAAVSTGRKIPLEKLREFADGRIHVGQEAVQFGLVDGVKTLDETLASMQSQGAPSQGRAMATSTPAPVAHTPSADPIQAFTGAVRQQTAAGLSQEDAVATVAKANQGLFAQYLSAAFPGLGAADKLDALNLGRIPTSSTPPFEKGSSMSSSTPNQAPQGQADPVAEFNAAVQANVAGGLDRRQAVSAVAKADPVLHARYLAATNPSTDAAMKLDIIQAAEETAEKQGGTNFVTIYHDAVCAKMATGMSRPNAHKAVRREHPALHQAVLDANQR